MVIYIPRANDFPDIFNVSKYFDFTFEYLMSWGIKDISEFKGEFLKTSNAVRLSF